MRWLKKLFGKKAAVSLIQFIEVPLSVPDSEPWHKANLTYLTSSVRNRALAELDRRYGDEWCSSAESIAVQESREITFLIGANQSTSPSEVLQVFQKEWNKFLNGKMK